MLSALAASRCPPPHWGRVKVGVEAALLTPHPTFPPSRGEGVFTMGRPHPPHASGLIL